MAKQQSHPASEAGPPSAAALRMDATAVDAFIAAAFPEVPDHRRSRIAQAAPGHVRMTMMPDTSHLRPGNIVSGPTQMALADHAAYALVLAHIGPVAMAVTSSLTMHFLRACQPGLLTADARLLRLGRRLVISDVQIWTDSPDRPVAQASVTYIVP